jgi:dTDP-4-dehydrorhamnose reductase
MRIFVSGSRGMLAHSLLPMISREHDVVGVDLPELDITNYAAIESMLRVERPDVIINCAAYTAVDRAESEPELCYAVNCEAVRNLAALATSNNAELIQISTDYVYDGQKTTPYFEDDPTGPQGVYAKAKLDGEVALRQTCERHYIMRSSWLYGAGGNNFVSTMLRLAKETDRLKVVDDQTGCPTWCRELARAIALVMGSGKYGTYNACGGGQTNWFGFARQILQLSGMDPEKIQATTAKEFGLKAPRPSYSAMDCSKLERAFGWRPRPWQEALEEYLST